MEIEEIDNILDTPTEPNLQGNKNCQFCQSIKVIILNKLLKWKENPFSK